jgi:uncharacterized protein YegP (UPF0339 family)
MENPKFQIKRSTNNEFYFVLKSKNGETILKASETYSTKQGCQNGIASVKENAPYDSRYNRKNGVQYTFNLEAANGKVLGNSETYTTASNREGGIEAVKRDAPGAPTEDLT